MLWRNLKKGGDIETYGRWGPVSCLREERVFWGGNFENQGLVNNEERQREWGVIRSWGRNVLVNFTGTALIPVLIIDWVGYVVWNEVEDNGRILTI